MTAEQEKWVKDLTTHPVLSQASLGGLSTPREPRESASAMLASQSQGDYGCQGGSLMDGASRASTVPMSIPPASGSGRVEGGDGYGSDLLGGNYLRDRAIQGSASLPGLIGAPSSAQRAREHMDAGFREMGDAKAARDQVRSALEARERALSALEACDREDAERASAGRGPA